MIGRTNALLAESTPSGWQPNADMVWAKGICENDVQSGFTYKLLQMINNQSVYTDIVVPSGGAVKTSDGGYYTANAQHTWNDTSAHESQVISGIKIRWIIYYYTTGQHDNTSLLYNCIYACFDGLKFVDVFANIKSLQYFDVVNGANLKTTVTSMNNMFSSCSSLQSIPLLDTSAVTSMGNMFGSCSSLQSIPLLDTSAVTNMGNMFSYCYSLQTIPLLDTSAVTSMNSMFGYCSSLQTIPLLDTSAVTNMGSMFYNCSKLEYLYMSPIKVSLSISSSTKFSASMLNTIISNLYDLTGGTAQTLTIGSTNLAKLTAEEIAVATNKNWTVA